MALTDEQCSFLEDLVIRYSDILEKYCMRNIGYKSQYMTMVPDCVQKTFLSAIKNIDKLMTHKNPGGWLIVNCHYQSMALFKKRNGIEIPTENMEDNHEVNMANTLKSLDRWNQEILVDELMDTVAKLLTADEQHIFHDYFITGLSTQETADHNGLPYDTVRGRIRRLRNKLKKNFFDACLFLFILTYISRRR